MTTSEQPTELQRIKTKYFPSGVKVTDHVTLKLHPKNYLFWKQLMFSFLESQGLQGFVDGTISPMDKPPSWVFIEKRSAEEEEGLKRQKDWDQQWLDLDLEQMPAQCLGEWKKEQKDVEKWEHERMKEWKAEQERRSEAKWRWEQKQWQKLLQKHGEKRRQVWKESQEEESRQKLDQKRKQEWEQSQESVLMKEHERRKKWKETWKKKCKGCREEIWQELDQEIERRNEWSREREHQEKRKWERWEEWERGEKLPPEIRDVIREEYCKHTEWKRSDGLVREWILAVVTQEILPRVIHLKTAQDMWNKLEKIFTRPFKQLSSTHQLIDWTDQRTGEVLNRYAVLHKAAQEGDWETAKDFLKKEPDAVFRPITWNLETALIVAVRSDQRKKFAKKLIMRMVWESKKQERIEWIEKMREMEREMMEMMQHEMEKSEPEMMESLKRRELDRELVIGLERKEMESEEQKGLEAIEQMIEKKEREGTEWLGLDMERTERDHMMKIVDKMMQNMMDRLKKIEQEMSERTKQLMMEETKWQMIEGMVRDMMQRMGQSVMLLAETDISGATALHTAVEGGNIEVVEWLVSVNPLLANILDMDGTLPVHLAARLGNREMVELLLVCDTKISDEKLCHKLWHSMVSGGLYDRALALLQDHPKVASIEPSPLMELTAQNNRLFPSGTHLNFLQHLIYSGILLKLEDTADRPQGWDIENQNSAKCVVPPLMYRNLMQKLKAMLWDFAEEHVPYIRRTIKSIRKTKLIHHEASMLVKCLCEKVVETDFTNAAKIFKEPLFAATRLGIPEIVKEIVKSYPGAIHMTSKKNRSIFHIAITYRQRKVYDLINQMAEDKRAILMSMPDVWGNNALHLAGKLGLKQQLSIRKHVDGAFPQIQSEFYWFQEVEKVILPQAKERKNLDGKTPQDLFMETHKELVIKGEEWMKNTVNSCSIVAILIMTIAFAAAITVPGGSDSTGIPIRLKDSEFTVFGISNALALMGSSASLLMFLSIQMGHYRELDFLDSIPTRMAFGLLTLFGSVICMLVAFFAAFITVFGEKKRTIVIPVAVLSSVPSFLLVLSIGRSLLDMIKTIYNSKGFWSSWKQHYRNLRRIIKTICNDLVYRHCRARRVHVI